MIDVSRLSFNLEIHGLETKETTIIRLLSIPLYFIKRLNPIQKTKLNQVGSWNQNTMRSSLKLLPLRETLCFSFFAVPFLLRLQTSSNPAHVTMNHIKLPFLNSSSWVKILDFWVKINLWVNKTFMSSFFNVFSISAHVPSSIPRQPGLKGTGAEHFRMVDIEINTPD